MSTITVAKKNGYAAISADSLSSWDSKDSADYVVNHHKILQVGENYIAVCGATSLKVVLSDYFSSLDTEIHLGSVGHIFTIWKRLHEVLKDEYFMNPEQDEDDSFESSRMSVLIANRHGIFGVSSHRAVQEFSKFYAYGKGREYALGAMYCLFADKGKTAEEIARRGVQAAAEFDDSTGLPEISFTVPLSDSAHLRSRSSASRIRPTKAKSTK